MKKTLISIIPILACAALCACGNKNAEAPAVIGTVSEISEAIAEAEEKVTIDEGKVENVIAPQTNTPEFEGGTLEVGTFNVDVPEGWHVFFQRDMAAGRDEDGQFPIDETMIGLIKGGESDMDAFSKPTVYIYYCEGPADTLCEKIKGNYKEVEDIEVKSGDQICPSFKGTAEALTKPGSFYTYEVVFVPAGDNNCVQAVIPVDMIDFEGVSVEDEDVQSIIDTIKVN